MVSERRACAVVGQARATERYAPRESADEAALRARIVALATRFGRYGYRRITSLLREEGWQVNHKRVERLWREEGLRVPKKQPKRGRLYLADGSIVRLRAEHPNHVWAYDFVLDHTADGRKLRMLTVVDEYTRECLAIAVARRLSSEEVLAVLADLCVRRGPPTYIRSDNDPSLRRGRYDAGSDGSTCRRSSSSPAVPGRTGTSNRSTDGCATSSSTGNASTRCSKHRC